MHCTPMYLPERVAMRPAAYLPSYARDLGALTATPSFQKAKMRDAPDATLRELRL